jgi:hypothetical protein
VGIAMGSGSGGFGGGSFITRMSSGFDSAEQPTTPDASAMAHNKARAFMTSGA